MPDAVATHCSAPSIAARRSSNMFEERLAAMEGAEQCVATASGMSAILACVMGVLKAGDHIVASRSLFGATVNLFNNIIKKFGVETTYVSATDVAEWKAAVRPNTRLLFLECLLYTSDAA